jgi:signal transduction histidine kinase
VQLAWNRRTVSGDISFHVSSSGPTHFHQQRHASPMHFQWDCSLRCAAKQLKLARAREGHLSGLLISAEEKERRRIASELHDDFSQRLAVLALGLENVDEATPASFPDVHKQLRRLVKSTSELGADLHTPSHQLHSSTLESLGLVPAVAAICKEFTAQQGIKVEFT